MKICKSRVQGDGVGIIISFLDDAEEEGEFPSTYLDQTGPTSEVNAKQFNLPVEVTFVLVRTHSRSLCLIYCKPSGLSSLPEG